MNRIRVQLVFKNVADAEIRNGHVNLSNVGIDRGDLFDRGVKVLHSVGTGGYDVPVGFMHANEVDMDFVACGTVSEDELPPVLEGLLVLNAYPCILYFLAQAVIFEAEVYLALFDDGACFE